ncbi:uncharacterized protein BDZ99DRAFT_554766 [Mytilinidion resinicola]|uniref:Protein kinase domain-containing protein n=1 Tax=Mytilinidion resinicola TaxID=574789 RepID=A0A6A6Z1Z3_9PEZI|nr:uncharacterized protein BDZ99DRAFT_554766 [Mytilinidion resinicola]KAF2814314.1 hypothetical protein BDZ99DRAFT_554766 [Mytilinidion resinicola]
MGEVPPALSPLDALPLPVLRDAPMEESKKISEVSQEDSVTEVEDLGNPLQSDQLLTYGNIVVTDFSMAGTFNAKNKPTKAMERGSNNREYIALFNLAQADQHGKLRGVCLENSESLLPYTGPELLKYDDMYTGPWVDVWSCGIILYAMLCGSLPFYDDLMNPMGDNIIMLQNYINLTPLTFPSYVTSSARKLISAMLEPELRKRIGVRGMQVGPWHYGY